MRNFDLPWEGTPRAIPLDHPVLVVFEGRDIPVVVERPGHDPENVYMFLDQDNYGITKPIGSVQVWLDVMDANYKI